MENGEVGEIIVERWGLRLYDELKFYRRRPRGKVIANIQVGERLKIKDLIPGFQSDGFQWCEVFFKGEVAYCKCDFTNSIRIGERE